LLLLPEHYKARTALIKNEKSECLTLSFVRTMIQDSTLSMDLAY